MKLIGSFPATLAGLVLFLAPGLAFLGLLPARECHELDWDERLFLVVAGSVTVSAWLALTLAELGRFSLLAAAVVLALASAGAVWIGRRRWRWPLVAPRRLAAAWPALAVLGLALVFQARPTEYLLGGRDPGTYVASMALIARTGGIAYVDPAVASIPAEDVELFYRNPDGPDFNWARFMGFPLESPRSARVVPEFFHLFPAFGAYLFQAMGVKGALATPPVFGVLGTLAVFFALRRIFSPATALLGATLLSLNVVQVWFARFPVSEPVSQFLVFLGLLAFARWEEDGSTAFGLLAGTAFGLSLLVRIDSVLLLVPLGLYLLVRRAHRDLSLARALPLVVPLVALAGHAVLHASIWSRKYLVNIATRPYWRQPAAVWVAVAVGVLAVIAAVHLVGPSLVRKMEARGQGLRLAVMAVVTVLALHACFVRPVLSAWAGADGNDPVSAAMTPWLPDHPLAHHGWLDALGYRRLAAHDAQSLLRLGWFVHPVGLLLGVLGLLLALREWRPRYLLPLLTVLAFALFYCYKIRIYNDYFFALRRFVPVVLPFLFGFAALMLTRLAAAGGVRRALAGLLALGLAVAYLRQTLPLFRYVDWKNSVRFVADVARRFGPRDVVIFEQKESLHLLSLPLWAVHGVNALELARFNPDPERLNHLVRSWRPRYGNIYFVYTYRTDLCGIFLQTVESPGFATQEWERAYSRPPRGPVAQALHFTVARVVLPEELSVPALDVVDIGGSDDFQVSGFYDKEGDYRWTGRCGSVYLPAARAGRAVAITACTGRRPESLAPAVVRVSLSGVPLGSFTAAPRWATYTVPLPAATAAFPVLRLDVVDPDTGRPRTWRPANVLPGSDDTRDLGVMVDRVAVVH